MWLSNISEQPLPLSQAADKSKAVARRLSNILSSTLLLAGLLRAGAIQTVTMDVSLVLLAFSAPFSDTLHRYYIVHV
jgi:hypothetical protein